MADLLQRLKARKLVQWAVAYLAAAWVLLQVLDLASGSYGWPRAVMHIAFGVLAVGFVVVLVLAWYHGERGVQRINGVELLIIALVLAVGGGVLWNFSRTSGKAGGTHAVASVHKAGPAGPSASGAVANKPPAIAASTATPAIPAVAVQPIPAKSVAVLPFENLSADKNNAYFADGIQDLILTKLADIGDLKVISRTSTMQYGSHPENLRKIGAQLGVATILEGSVQKAGNQVLINVQLIDAQTDSHLWAESYTRNLTNIFGVEGEVADKVAAALNAKLTAQEATRVANVPTHDPVAYDLYLRAQRVFDQVAANGWGELPTAIAAYQKVVQRDPRFALAWANLSFSQLLLHWTGMDLSPEVLREAEANVRKALALQPHLPAAHVVLGYVYRWRYDDYAKALAEYKLAAAGLPNSADVAAAIGFIHEIEGDMPAAIVNLKRATMLDPRNPHWACQLAIVYMGTGNYGLARQALARAFAINPDFAEAYANLSRVDLLESADAASALKLLDGAPATIRASTLLVGARISALLLQRNFAAARHAAEQLQRGQGMSALQFAQVRGNVLWLSGLHKEAAPYYAKALNLLEAQLPATTKPLQANAEAALAAARLGRAAATRQYAQKMTSLAAQAGRTIPYDLGITPWVTLASAYASMGDDGAAVAALGKALARKSGRFISVPMVKLDPTWDPIRKDPAFQALLQKYDTMSTARASAAPSTAASAVGDGH